MKNKIPTKLIKTVNALLTTFVCLLTLNTPVYAFDTTTYYHHDGLGSTVAATDEAGNVKWREDYRPYGERVDNPTNGENKHWFTGKPEEPALGLQYFGARWYDPALGRFTSIDPVSFQEGNIHSFNRYVYANNNPYVYVDPNGEEAIALDVAKGYANALISSYAMMSPLSYVADFAGINYKFSYDNQTLGENSEFVSNIGGGFAGFGPKLLRGLTGLISRGSGGALKFGANDLVLGLNKNQALTKYVENVGGKTYSKFITPRGSFDVQIRSAMDQASTIRFNLKGVNTKLANGKLNSYGEPAAGYTNYELHLIKTTPKYLNKTKFYDGNKLVNNPFK